MPRTVPTETITRRGTPRVRCKKGTRTCANCRKKYPTGTGAAGAMCSKLCNRVWQKRYRKGHSEQYRKYKNLDTARLRVLALLTLGHRCQRCGEIDPRVLQVDHVSGNGSKEKKALGRTGVLRRVLKNPMDYQLLCANCNVRKAFDEKEFYPNVTRN